MVTSALTKRPPGSKRLRDAGEKGGLGADVRHMVQGEGGGHRIAARQRLVERLPAQTNPLPEALQPRLRTAQHFLVHVDQLDDGRIRLLQDRLGQGTRPGT